MELSDRARAMLARSTRFPCPTSRDDIVHLIEQEQLPIFDTIVDFQQRFGGIEYRVGRNKDGFLLGILPTWHDGINGFEEQGRYFFECAQHSSAQLRFFMDQDGVFYVDDFPLASTIETYIESDAIGDEMIRQGGWRSKDLGEVARNDRRIDARISLPVIPEASDAYLIWWGDETTRINRIGFWAPVKQLDMIFVYGKTRKDVARAKDMLAGLTERHNV